MVIIYQESDREKFIILMQLWDTLRIAQKIKESSMGRVTGRILDQTKFLRYFFQLFSRIVVSKDFFHFLKFIQQQCKSIRELILQRYNSLKELIKKLLLTCCWVPVISLDSLLMIKLKHWYRTYRSLVNIKVLLKIGYN
jgi:hypothetical protein